MGLEEPTVRTRGRKGGTNQILMAVLQQTRGPCQQDEVEEAELLRRVSSSDSQLRLRVPHMTNFGKCNVGGLFHIGSGGGSKQVEGRLLLLRCCLTIWCTCDSHVLVALRFWSHFLFDPLRLIIYFIGYLYHCAALHYFYFYDLC